MMTKFNKFHNLRNVRSLQFESLSERIPFAGDLDTQFGDFGWLSDPIVHTRNASDQARAMTTDAAGRILVLGDTNGTVGTRSLISVTRLLPSGQLDPSFQGGSTYAFGLWNGIETAVDIAVQSSGRTVVLVNIDRNDGSNTRYYVLVGLKENGGLDTSFGDRGIVEGRHDFSVNYQAGALLIGLSGEIFVHYNDNHTLYLSKYSADGSMDAEFGVSGTFHYTSMLYAQASDVTIDGAGRITLAASVDDGLNFAALLIRTDSAGAMIANFGTDGAVKIPTTNDRANTNLGRIRIAYSSSGDLLVAGVRRTNIDQEFFVQRLDFMGQPVSQFGQDGEAKVKVFAGQNAGTLLQDLFVDSSDNVFITGLLGYFSTPVVVQLDSAGIQSPAEFVYLPQPMDSRGLGAAVLLSSRGKLMLTYSSDSFFAGRTDIVVFPFDITTGTFEPQDTVSINAMNEIVASQGNDIIELADGNLLTMSTDFINRAFEPFHIYLTRRLPNGSIDTSYATNGRLAINVSQNLGRLPNQFISNNNETFIVFQEGYNLRIARLTGTGEIDSTFGSVGWIDWAIASGPLGIPQIYSVAATADGFLVAGDLIRDVNAEVDHVIKLDRAGKQISTFGDAGEIAIPRMGIYGFESQLQLQSDGKFLLSLGQVEDFFSVAIRRYFADGTLDNSFADSGILKIEFPSHFASASRKLSVLDDDKLLILATTIQEPWPGKTPVVAMYSKDGHLDAAFGVRTLPRILDGTVALDLLIDSQERILILGKSSDTKQDDPVVYRLLPNGELDMSFGVEGIRRIQRNGNDDKFTTITATADDDILLAGTSVGKQFNDPVFVRLSETPPAWHNAKNIFDVNSDGLLTPMDALLVINYLNARTEPILSNNHLEGLPYIDVNGDQLLTPIDALMVINLLNLQSALNREAVFDEPPSTVAIDAFYYDFWGESDLLKNRTRRTF